MDSFMDMMRSRWTTGHFVNLGFNCSCSQLPSAIRECSKFDDWLWPFNEQMINGLGDQCGAFMFNMGFYTERSLGRTLLKSIRTAQGIEGIPIILDAKRADVGDLSMGYVDQAFSPNRLGVDAITLNPYLGQAALQPFIEYDKKGVLVLCRTSEPGAKELQDLEFAFASADQLAEKLKSPVNDLPLDEWRDNPHKMLLIPQYLLVALRVSRQWNTYGNCGLIVAPDDPVKLRNVRRVVGSMPILVPDVDECCSNLEAVLQAGLTPQDDGLIIGASRSILLAKKDDRYFTAAKSSLESLNGAIRSFIRRRDSVRV